jgi:hypothetical protein
MPRYYNKVTRTESLDPAAPDVVELPDDNVFWTPRPAGHRLVYDVDDLPLAYEAVPDPAIGTDAAIRKDLGQADLTTRRLLMGLIRADRGDRDAIESIYTTLGNIASKHSVTVDYVINLMDI